VEVLNSKLGCSRVKANIALETWVCLQPAILLVKISSQLGKRKPNEMQRARLPTCFKSVASILPINRKMCTSEDILPYTDDII
jgi:hypothetical protein